MELRNIRGRVGGYATRILGTKGTTWTSNGMPVPCSLKQLQ
jgi:hypothetical protein